MFRQGLLLSTAVLSLISTVASAQPLAAKNFRCGSVKNSFEQLKIRNHACRLYSKVHQSKDIESLFINGFEQFKPNQSIQIGWVSWRSQGSLLELKSAPFSAARAIASLEPGTTLKIHRKIAISNNRQHQWYDVETKGRRGFVWANTVDLLDIERGAGGSIPEVALQPHPTASAPLLGFCHPLMGAGVISQGPHGFHSHQGRMEYAFDLAVGIGTPVYAMRSGKVLKVEDEFPDTGGGEENVHKFNYVLIEHTKEYRSAYMHLEQGFQARVGIRPGDRLQAGQLIGYSGDSGWSTGPHLHIEIHHAALRGSFGQTVPFEIDRICGSEVIALAQATGKTR